MLRLPTRFLAPLAFVPVLVYACATTPEAPAALEYPAAPPGETVDDYHGTQVADPYRWLEDPDSEETRRWIEAENELTFGWLARVPGRDELRARIEALWNYERTSTPIARGGRYFYRKNDGLADQAVLYVSESLEAEGRVLLDPASFSEDGTVALSETVPSPDGELLAYSTSDGGSDWRTWHFLEVESGELLDDVITRNKFGGLDWTEGNRGVVYARYALPAEGAELRELNAPPETCLHTLGEAREQDLVLHEAAPEGFSTWAQVSNSRRAVVLTTVDRNTRHAEVSILPLGAAGQVRALPLIGGFDAQYQYIGNQGNEHIWFRTDLEAPNWRVIEIDLTRPDRDHWRELVPEREIAMSGVRLVGGRFVIEYLRDAQSEVQLYTTAGELQQTVELPGLGSVGGFTGEPDQRLAFFSYSDFSTPSEVWSLDVESGETRLFKRPTVDFDPAAYESRQVFYESKDGTRIPMFVVHKRGLDLNGRNPTLLYGYGGFNISLAPSFRVPNLVWMELGGVYALANLRGGGEYGEAWHEAGIKLHKQNVFDDFIAAAEWLEREGYTSPKKLAIEGGSNGGLLVGACMTQRPELYGAALPAVGVMDMLRYPLFTIGWAWAGDYGTADDPAEFAALLAYSPLHNLREGVHYPATLITTGDHDDRVVPAHSFKFAARLQAVQAGPAPCLIRIETRAGHGAGTPTHLRIDLAADKLAFLKASLGME